ncbi:hypothetical protein MMC07_005597 [Pseudocyphellaria aurata]|nr:hypothetical protein [Pseudocyphellaria aurata]
MRLSVLAGAVLLASGFLVLSRPLSAQQEARDLSFESFPYNLNLASAWPDSGTANTYLASSGIPEPPPKVDTANFFTPGTSPAPQGINLALPSGPSTINPITPAAETSPGIYGNYLSQSPAGSTSGLTRPDQNSNFPLSITPSVGNDQLAGSSLAPTPPNQNDNSQSITTPSFENAPTISDEVKESFEDFKNQESPCIYRFYEFSWLYTGNVPSSNQLKLDPGTCKKSLYLGKFEQDFWGSRPGFVLVLAGTGVFSMMNNLQTDCPQRLNGQFQYDSNDNQMLEKPCPDLRTAIHKLQPAWEAAVHKAFPDRKLQSSPNLITSLRDLGNFVESSGLSSLFTPGLPVEDSGSFQLP